MIGEDKETKDLDVSGIRRLIDLGKLLRKVIDTEELSYQLDMQEMRAKEEMERQFWVDA